MKNFIKFLSNWRWNQNRKNTSAKERDPRTPSRAARSGYAKIDITETIKILWKGIEWINIDYFNNKPIVNLIEARPGILTLLDEECLRPGVTNDETLLDKFNTYLNKEQFYESREKNKKEK